MYTICSVSVRILFSILWVFHCKKNILYANEDQVFKFDNCESIHLVQYLLRYMVCNMIILCKKMYYKCTVCKYVYMYKDQNNYIILCRTQWFWHIVAITFQTPSKNYFLYILTTNWYNHTSFEFISGICQVFAEFAFSNKRM